MAHCPELGIASQGYSVEEANANLREAIDLFLETASDTELQTRLYTAAQQFSILNYQLSISPLRGFGDGVLYLRFYKYVTHSVGSMQTILLIENCSLYILFTNH